MSMPMFDHVVDAGPSILASTYISTYSRYTDSYNLNVFESDEEHEKLKEMFKKYTDFKATMLPLFDEELGRLEHTIKLPDYSEEYVNVYYDVLAKYLKELALERVDRSAAYYSNIFDHKPVSYPDDEVRGILDMPIKLFLERKALELESTKNAISAITREQLIDNSISVPLEVFGNKYQSGTKMSKILSQFEIADAYGNRMLTDDMKNEKIYISYHPTYMTLGGRISSSCYSPGHENEHATWTNLYYDKVAIVFNHSFTKRAWVIIDQNRKLFRLAKMYPQTNPFMEFQVMMYFIKQGYKHIDSGINTVEVEGMDGAYFDFSSAPFSIVISKHLNARADENTQSLTIYASEVLQDIVKEYFPEMHQCDNCGDLYLEKGSCSGYCDSCGAEEEE